MDINKIHARVTERLQMNEQLSQETLEAYEIKKRKMVEEIVKEQLAAHNVMRISCKKF
jgi:hypothetical protein